VARADCLTMEVFTSSRHTCLLVFCLPLFFSGTARRKRFEFSGSGADTFRVLSKYDASSNEHAAVKMRSTTSDDGCSLPAFVLEAIRASVSDQLAGALRKDDPMDIPAVYDVSNYQGDLQCPLRFSNNRANVTLSDFSDTSTIKNVTCLGSTCINRNRWTRLCTQSHYKLRVLAGFDTRVRATQTSDLEMCGVPGTGTAEMSWVSEDNELTAVADVDYAVGGEPKLLSQKLTEAKLGEEKDVKCEFRVSSDIQLDGDKVCEHVLKSALENGLASAIEDAVVSGGPPTMPPPAPRPPAPDPPPPLPGSPTTPGPGPGPSPGPAREPDQVPAPAPAREAPVPVENMEKKPEPAPWDLGSAVGIGVLLTFGVGVIVVSVVRLHSFNDDDDEAS